MSDIINNNIGNYDEYAHKLHDHQNYMIGQHQVYRPEFPVQYQGAQTASARVKVDNVDRTISVDVNRYFIDQAAKAAINDSFDQKIGDLQTLIEKTQPGMLVIKDDKLYLFSGDGKKMYCCIGIYNGIQKKLNPGENIIIDRDNNISAIDTKYYAGKNIEIDENNRISVKDFTYVAGKDIEIVGNQIRFTGKIPSKLSDLYNDGLYITTDDLEDAKQQLKEFDIYIKNRVDSLESSLNVNTQYLNSLRDSINLLIDSDVQEQIVDVRNSIAKVKEQNGILSGTIDDTNSDVAKLNSRLTTYISDLEELRANDKIQDKDIAELKLKDRDLDFKINQNINSTSENTKDISAVKQEINLINQENVNLSINLTNEIVKRKELQNKVEDRLTLYDATKEKLDSYIEENDKKVDTLISDFESINNTVNEFTSNVDSTLKDHIEESNKTLEQLRQTDADQNEAISGINLSLIKYHNAVDDALEAVKDINRVVDLVDEQIMPELERVDINSSNAMNIANQALDATDKLDNELIDLVRHVDEIDHHVVAHHKILTKAVDDIKSNKEEIDSKFEEVNSRFEDDEERITNLEEEVGDPVEYQLDEETGEKIFDENGNPIVEKESTGLYKLIDNTNETLNQFIDKLNALIGEYPELSVRDILNKIFIDEYLEDNDANDEINSFSDISDVVKYVWEHPAKVHFLEENIHSLNERVGYDGHVACDPESDGSANHTRTGLFRIKQDKLVAGNGIDLQEDNDDHLSEISVNLDYINETFYNKEETDERIHKFIDESSHLSRQIVDSLDSISEPDDRIVYMIKRSEDPDMTIQNQSDVYDEYLYNKETSEFELIGNTAVDFTDYYNKSEIDEKVSDIQLVETVDDDGVYEIRLIKTQESNDI